MRQMRLLSAAALLNDGQTLTRTCRQVLEMKERQVVKNMHGNVHGLKLRLALKKTLIGRISKGFGFLGHRGYRRYGFGVPGLTGLAQQTNDNDNHQQKLLRLNEPSASDQRVGNYVTDVLQSPALN